VGPAFAAIPPGRYAIGDSVMLGASDELTSRGIKVNAVVSRQFRDAVPIVQRLKAAGKLRRKVIIHLGNNGILIAAADCDRISQIAGPGRTLYLVTLKILRWYRRTQNERLAACAQRRTNTVLIDWFGYSRQHPVVVRGRGLPPHIDRSDEVRVLDRDGNRLIGSRGRIGRLGPVACPSGRRDTPGKRVGGLTPSRVRIPRPPRSAVTSVLSSPGTAPRRPARRECRAPRERDGRRRSPRRGRTGSIPGGNAGRVRPSRMSRRHIERRTGR
jgi:hypothetical protein